MNPKARKFLILFPTLLVVTIACMALVGLYQHWRETHEQAAATALAAEHRQFIVNDLTQHCLKGAREANIGVPDQKNVDYCNCAMPLAVSKMDDSDFLTAPTPDLRAEIRSQMQEAGKVCRAKIFPETLK